MQVQVFTMTIRFVRSVGAVEDGVALLIQRDTRAIVAFKLVWQTRRIMFDGLVVAVVLVVAIGTVRFAVAPFIVRQAVAAAARVFRGWALVRSRVDTCFRDGHLNRSGYVGTFDG